LLFLLVKTLGIRKYCTLKIHLLASSFMSWSGRVSILLVIVGSGHRKWTRGHPVLAYLGLCIGVLYTSYL